MDVGYASNDDAQVRRQVEDMMSRGISGAIADWYGANAQEESPTQLLKKEAEAHQGFEFGVAEDSGALFTAAGKNGCDVTDQLIADLKYIVANYLASPAYMRMNGKLPIFMFGVSGYYIDWTRVLPTVPANAVLLFRGREGLQQNYANGGYAWIDIPSGHDPADPSIAAQDTFYNLARQSGRITMGSVYKGFDDPIATWGTNRQVAQQRRDQRVFANLAQFHC